MRLPHWLAVMLLQPAFKGGSPMIVFYIREWRYMLNNYPQRYARRLLAWLRAFPR